MNVCMCACKSWEGSLMISANHFTIVGRHLCKFCKLDSILCDIPHKVCMPPVSWATYFDPDFLQLFARILMNLQGRIDFDGLFPLTLFHVGYHALERFWGTVKRDFPVGCIVFFKGHFYDIRYRRVFDRQFEPMFLIWHQCNLHRRFLVSLVKFIVEPFLWMTRNECLRFLFVSWSGKKLSCKVTPPQPFFNH